MAVSLVCPFAFAFGAVLSRVFANTELVGKYSMTPPQSRDTLPSAPEASDKSCGDAQQSPPHTQAEQKRSSATSASGTSSALEDLEHEVEVEELVKDLVLNKTSQSTVAMGPATVSTNFFRRVYCILGLPFDAVTLAQAVEALKRAAQGRERCFLSTPNLNFLVGCRSDSAFRDSVLCSNLSVADGMPIVWIGRLLGAPVPERVAGSSLFERLFTLPNQISVYFFGGPDGAAEQAAHVVNTQGSKVRCVGFQSPGFGSLDELSKSDMIAHINSCNPDFLIVAAGAKKGQAWIVRNRETIGAPIISHLGAVVNLVAGRIDRAPYWMQQMGLEWLWRITQEPALWRRYANDGLRLAGLVLTRAVPAVLQRRMTSIPQRMFEQASVRLDIVDEQAKLTLSGAWCEANAGPLRLAFSRATVQPRDVVLNLDEVCFMDSACIGLLALLYGHQWQVGRGWSPVCSGSSLRRILHAQCAEYLLTERKVNEVNEPQSGFSCDASLQITGDKNDPLSAAARP